MGIFNTTLYDAQKSTRANPARLPNANSASGAVHVVNIAYPLTGGGSGEITGSTINLCILPAGVTPLPMLSKVQATGDPGTTLTIDVGTAQDQDVWAAGLTLTTLTAAGTLEFAPTLPLSLTAPAPLDPDVSNIPGGSGNVVVYATVTSGTGVANNVTLYFQLAYKIGG